MITHLAHLAAECAIMAIYIIPCFLMFSNLHIICIFIYIAYTKLKFTCKICKVISKVNLNLYSYLHSKGGMQILQGEDEFASETYVAEGSQSETCQVLNSRTVYLALHTSEEFIG